MQIFLNCQKVEVENETGLISYEELCALAGHNPDHTPTVTWSTKASCGSLTRGQSAPLCERSIYEVCITGAA